jgi:hypothetical protein
MFKVFKTKIKIGVQRISQCFGVKEMPHPQEDARSLSGMKMNLFSNADVV